MDLLSVGLITIQFNDIESSKKRTVISNSPFWVINLVDINKYRVECYVR